MSSWTLSTYGRCRQTKSKSSEVHQYQVNHSEEQPLVLALTETLQLLVTKGTEVLENHSLVHSSMTVVQKNQAMIFLRQAKNGNTWFRIKFLEDSVLTATARRDHCLSKLERLIHVKRVQDPADSQKSVPQEDLVNADGATRLSTVAKVMSGDIRTELPLVYQGASIPDNQLEMMVRLCLSDADFPNFVGQVEKMLQKIKEES